MDNNDELEVQEIDSEVFRATNEVAGYLVLWLNYRDRLDLPPVTEDEIVAALLRNPVKVDTDERRIRLAINHLRVAIEQIR